MKDPWVWRYKDVRVKRCGSKVLALKGCAESKGAENPGYVGSRGVSL